MTYALTTHLITSFNIFLIIINSRTTKLFQSYDFPIFQHKNQDIYFRVIFELGKSHKTTQCGKRWFWNFARTTNGLRTTHNVQTWRTQATTNVTMLDLSSVAISAQA